MYMSVALTIEILEQYAKYGYMSVSDSQNYGLEYAFWAVLLFKTGHVDPVVCTISESKHFMTLGVEAELIL
jgi:hypothetical protein